jgi:hypothetical protein
MLLAWPITAPLSTGCVGQGYRPLAGARRAGASGGRATLGVDKRASWQGTVVLRRGCTVQ